MRIGAGFQRAQVNDKDLNVPPLPWGLGTLRIQFWFKLVIARSAATSAQDDSKILEKIQKSLTFE